MEVKNKSWFAEWFNTPFYHILYKNRSYEEAQQFISRLTKKLNIPHGSRILDLACGKGRHAKTLSELGFNVTGVDLSEQSIAHANTFANDHLSFFVRDMRKPFELPSFDYVFNLFTSFGYFEDDEDNIKTLKNVHDALTPNGTLVFDFMNATKVVNELTTSEVIVEEGINFSIRRYVKEGYIIKEIEFNHQGKDYSFEERVQKIELKDFEQFFAKTDFSIYNIYGDYTLAPFDIATSDRLILIVKKK